MKSLYQPEAKILANYADVLVNFALNSGQGLRAGEVVDCVVPDVAKPLALALQTAIIKAGGHPLVRLMPTGFDRLFFELASQSQLEFFPRKFLRARANLIDHQIVIIADTDPTELKDIDPQKIFQARNAKKAYRDWLTDKETQGKFTWTLGLWGTQAKADEVGLSLPDYWQQIIDACFLNAADPVGEWRKIAHFQEQVKRALNEMRIDSVHVTGPDLDLVVGLGEDRVWKAGGGRNIPSFECFTSPDWRKTNGSIKFNQPLYRYGNIIKDIALQFVDGLVVKATASQGQALLEQMLQTKNANKLGEFSLTDKNTSKITHLMAETLFDENIGGPFGNMHVAIGMAYRDCYRGDQKVMTKKDWAAKGFNDSAEHTDMITTSDRTVTATLTNGTKRVIYAAGSFVL